ncbi:MAG TPA: Ltp family lipoprotein, partial [Ilumatobacteraceae bacterium]|nr:Ltp family lipoprotein [Ilumatobacteraceae bacterium]
TIPATTEAPVVTDAPAVEAPVTTPEPSMTVSQKNAIKSAESYLSFMGFSRQGLIDQLSSEFGEKFSVEDATFAVDSLAVDWNEQAAKSAQTYLDTMGFSCQKMIDQLSSEYGSKFTVEQATYGATAVGLC